ncbi:MAG TPA: hypothetical protein VML01_05060 [Bryobacterales bacterium]|nr:hypothetical protein [Bryobacterales bacterium]
MSITTTDPKPEKTTSSTPAIVFALVLVAAAATNVYLFSRVKTLEVEAHTMRQQIEAELARANESSAYRTTQARREFEELREQVNKAQSQITQKTDANTRAHTQRLADTVAKKQREQQELLLGELQTVSGKAGVAQEGVNEVRGDVLAIKTDAQQTRLDLSETGAAVRSTQNQLIDLDSEVADTAGSIQELRTLTERQRVAFSLKKSDHMERVADIYLRLKDTNPKNNRFTMELMADDKKIEQKKKSVHEAMRFYLLGSEQPYEIVVTSVQKDRVNGYVTKAKFETKQIAVMTPR